MRDVLIRPASGSIEFKSGSNVTDITIQYNETSKVLEISSASAILGYYSGSGGATRLYGTASYALVAQSSPAAIGGTGTTQYIPRWLNSTTLEDSRLKDSGSHILLGNRVLISGTLPQPETLLTVGDYWPLNWTPNIRTAAIFNKSVVGTIINLIGDTATDTYAEVWFSGTGSEGRGRVRYHLLTDTCSR